MSFEFQLCCCLAQIPEYTLLADALLETQNSCSILPQGQNAHHTSSRHPACGQIWRGIAEYDFGSGI